MQRRHCIALNAYVRNEKWSQINNPSFYFNKLEKEAQHKSKASIRKEKINVRAEMKLK